MTLARHPMLDVVRGVAILLVLAFHLRLPTDAAALGRPLTVLADTGWVGVDLFFVLSGFLVGRIILAEAETPAGFDRARFFARRVLRLWPVLYLYLGTLLLIGGGEDWRLVVPVLLHVQNYAADIPSHLWSLAVEEHFYLAAAFALPPLLRRAGPGGVARLLLMVIVGCSILRPLALLAGESASHLQWQTQYRADALAAGVLIAWVERWRPEWLAGAARHRLLLLALALAVFALLATIGDDRLRFTCGLTLTCVGSAAAVVAAYGLPAPRRWARAAGLLAWFGAISYPLYIWHVSLARVADAVAGLIGLGWFPASLCWRYAVAIGGAALVARYVERPLMRLRPGYDRSDSARSPALATANN